MALSDHLEWPDKRAPSGSDHPLVLQKVQSFGSEPSERQSNRLIHGDNLAAMAALQQELAGKFELIYLDPPFLHGGEIGICTLRGLKKIRSSL